LIGINTALFSHTGSNVGIGFAVPVNMAKNVIEQIVAHREVKRGRIGVLVQDVTPELAQTLGVEGRGEVQDIWMAETRKEALVAFDAFVETYGVKYDKAVACLVKDREALLAFYDFPAEHWKHLRTTNPIESTFATIRHRTVRAKGCLSNKTALALIFKLAQAAEKSWRRLDGHHHLPKVIRGVTFTDGIEVVSRQAQAVAA
jgi:putative transposase